MPDKNTHERLLLHGYNSKPITDTLFQMARTDISIQLATIQLVVSTVRVFTKLDHTTINDCHKDTKSESNNLHRQQILVMAESETMTHNRTDLPTG